MENPFEALDHRLRTLEALLLEVLHHLRGNSPAMTLPDIGGSNWRKR